MIQEIIVSTQDSQGNAHIAPMGVHQSGEQWIILPFRPSTTLENLITNRCAVFNYCDDVRVFAGCLTGRRDWALHRAQQINAPVLSCALAYCEMQVSHIIDDELRPQIYCDKLNHVNISPFQGFNRAQYAVLEAAILVSRLNRLPLNKIEQEIAYLQIAIDKTAGEREREAWEWLMSAIFNFKMEYVQ